MEVIERVIEYGRSDSFRIYPIGDSHLGVLQADEEELKKTVAKIKADPKALVIGMGDYSDCVTQTDKRWDPSIISPWVKRDNIAESQRRRVVEIFNPIKDKFIAFLTGNHELSIRHYLQVNIIQNIIDDLGVPYGGYQCFIILKFRRKGSKEAHQVTIHAWHGAGSAQSEGARLMRLKRLVKEFDADIYLMGHLHGITHDITDRLVVRNGKIKSIPKIAAITGSYLQTYKQGVPPGYGEVKGFRPSHLGSPCIILKPDTQEMIYQS